MGTGGRLIGGSKRPVCPSGERHPEVGDPGRRVGWAEGPSPVLWVHNGLPNFPAHSRAWRGDAQEIQASELTTQKLVRKIETCTYTRWIIGKGKTRNSLTRGSFLLMYFNGTIWSCIGLTPNTYSLGLHAIQEILFWGARGTQWVDRPTDFLDPCRPASRPTSRAYRNLSHRACSCRRPVGVFKIFNSRTHGFTPLNYNNEGATNHITSMGKTQQPT